MDKIYGIIIIIFNRYIINKIIVFNYYFFFYYLLPNVLYKNLELTLYLIYQLIEFYNNIFVV